MIKLPMNSKKEGPTVGDASFLPEDYIQRRNELRTNVLSVTLFILVTLGVVGAFLVTNRQWNEVKDFQQAINVRYTKAAQDIELLKKLETQRAEHMHKAELTTSLIEKVPRSILLAELINRMPEQMVLIEFDLESERIDKPKVKRSKKGSKSFSKNKGKDENQEKPKTVAPQFKTGIFIVGVTPTHKDVAQYVAALRECALLQDIELVFSEATSYNQSDVFKYRIEATIRPDVDAREIDPVEHPRLKPQQEPPSALDLLKNLTGNREN